MVIGIFHLRCLSKNTLSLSEKFFWAVLYPNLFFLIVIKSKLLYLGGDIETNPGPDDNKHKFFTICQINVRSILAEADEPSIQAKFLKGLPPPKLCELKSFIRDNNFDLVALSETWLSTEISDDVLKTSGYPFVMRKDRNRHGGGIALLISESMAVTRLNNIEPDNEEIMCFDVTLPGTRPVKHAFLCLCYRPPDHDIVEFLDSLGNTIEHAQRGSYATYLAIGDFNCRSSSFWTADATKIEGRMLKALLDSHNLSQLVDFPTRFQGTQASCLDLIITDRPNFIKNITPYNPIHKCDHIPISFELNVKYPKIKSFKRMVWNFKRANWAQLSVDLQLYDWENIIGIESLDEMAKRWTEVFLDLAKKSVPHYETIIRPKDKPYINGAIKLLIRKRNRAFQKFGRTKTQNDWDYYKYLRNLVVAEIRKSQFLYYQNTSYKLMNESTSSKAWWKYVKILSGQEVVQTDCPLWKDGILIFDQKEKADLLNDFFASVTSLDRSESFPNENIVSPAPIPLKVITADDVHKVLSNLNISKATGPDLIGNFILKACSLPLAPILAKIFNRSLQEGHFPEVWKLAHITPIFKKGDRNQCTNYRPVSLLCCVSKVFERLVFNHLYPILKERGVFTPNQAGFQPGDSTLNQLNYILHKIHSSSDIGEETLIVFLDLTKAFDKVWHNGLIHKLNSFGLTGMWNEWFKSYLSSRKTRVVLNGQISGINSVKAGVPQGSVLGPLLFLLYINDIGVNLVSNAYLFADDTSLLKSGKNVADLARQINNDLEKIYSWAEYWKVGINANKSARMLISKKQNPSQCPILVIGNDILHEVNQHMHLGLIITSNLSWSAHINEIATRARRRLGVLKLLKYRVSRKVLEQCYFAYVRSVFDYADILYDNCTDNDKNILRNIHMDAARLVTGAKKGTHTEALIHNELGWETLEERRESHKLTMLFKVIHDKTPPYLKSVLPKMHSENVRLNRKYTFNSYSHKTSSFGNSFFPSTIGLWNGLTNEIRLNTNLNSFKRLLKANIIHKPPDHFYYTHHARNLSIIHTQMRLNCSNLKNDMFTMHISDSRRCPNCNYVREDSSHFFIHCNAYATIRNDLVVLCQNLGIQLTARNLLYGSDSLNLQQNKNLFTEVLNFIKNSKRFS